MAEGKALNRKQRLFVQEYLVDNNATQAAKRAGYSEKTAYAQGSFLLKHPEIASQIEAGIKRQEQEAMKRASKMGVTKERWAKELARIAFADMDDFIQVDDEGIARMVPSAQRKLKRSRIIKKITQSRSSSSGPNGDSESISETLELHDKIKALNLLGNHYGWVKPDSLELNGDKPVRLVIERGQSEPEEGEPTGE
jgi:phage terminase small subunit